MAIVHKVIILNKPFKLFGFSFIQLAIFVFTGLIGLWIGFSVPQVKVNGLPLGFLVFMLIICGGMVFVHATLIQPWQWWRNRILSLAGLLPTKILPRPQAPNIYIEENAKDKTNMAESALKERTWQL